MIDPCRPGVLVLVDASLRARVLVKTKALWSKPKSVIPEKYEPVCISDNTLSGIVTKLDVDHAMHEVVCSVEFGVNGDLFLVEERLSFKALRMTGWEVGAKVVLSRVVANKMAKLVRDSVFHALNGKQFGK